jgi:uncharacterized protein YndB with AHSA1/START domain
MPQALKDAYMAINPDKDALHKMYERDVARMQSFTDIKDEDIKAIKAPVLIICGDNDVVMPEHAIEMYRKMKHANLAIFPGGHGDYMGEIMSLGTKNKVPYLFTAMVDEFLAAPKSENKPTIEKEKNMAQETKTIQKEMVLPYNREKVWKAITDSNALAQWIYPNDFQPKFGHKFTFEVPGITVHCKVLECTPTTKLSYSWEGGPVIGTKVTYRLQSEGNNTHLFFEHSGFDTTIAQADTYIGGAEYGWNMMLGKLKNLLEKQ